MTIAWAFASLAVSHLVYDRSPLYGLSWLRVQPEIWANIHAGLDETSEGLRLRYPGTRGFIWDIFDAEQMTEPSIAQARATRSNVAGERVSWRKLPAGTATLDAVFLMFAAHELRSSEARAAFFCEIRRVLKPGGSAVILEHLRDMPNFLAYGPGCLHFHSRRTWQAAFAAAQLTLRSEQTITPFVHVFELAPQ